jgi:hypothetical protein
VTSEPQAHHSAPSPGEPASRTVEQTEQTAAPQARPLTVERLGLRLPPSLAALARRAAPAVRKAAPWVVYATLALACASYLNGRAALLPKWTQGYMASEGQPYILLQVRAFLHGRLALVPHPSGVGNDYDWGRGGMHQAWGLGVPLLATPFHVVGLLFGAPGFPDALRFLILYTVVCVVLARALHRSAREAPGSLIPSAATAGFVMVFPTFVGMVSSRFLIYEQTIATGVLWSVGLLAGVLLLLARATPLRLAIVCACAGFSTILRPPLGIYGGVTLALALLLAARAGLSLRARIAGVASYAATTGLYFLGNWARFGSPFNPGYENCVSGLFVNRLARWGLSFSKVPLSTAAKEMFATLFLLDPVPNQLMLSTPPAVRPYAVAERWREYYAPTFDLAILTLAVVALLYVGWRVVRGRLWRRDRSLESEVATVVGAWGLPPAIVLFFFYAKLGNMVTRYATDLVPAFAATCVCVGMAIVGAVRARRPAAAPSVQLAIAGVVALYLSSWHGWAQHMAGTVDAKTVAATVAEMDRASVLIQGVPSHFKIGEPRGPTPVRTHLQEWGSDGAFSSGMIFAMPHSPCVEFTFRSRAPAWRPEDQASLDGFRATADSDALVRCGPPVVDGDERRLTMCDPRPPPYLLDGMRLYSVASLDQGLTPIDRLRIVQIDSVPSCP